METQKRIAAERAKAEAEKEKAATAEKADSDKPKGDEDVVMESASDVPKITVEAPGEPASAAGSHSVATPTPVQPTPLHPSLPAKPGSVSATPSPAPTPAIAAPTPTQATASAPTPTVKPASASPVPKPVTPAPVLPKDPIIQKNEEVCACFFVGQDGNGKLTNVFLSFFSLYSEHLSGIFVRFSIELLSYCCGHDC